MPHYTALLLIVVQLVLQGVLLFVVLVLLLLLPIVLPVLLIVVLTSTTAVLHSVVTCRPPLSITVGRHPDVLSSKHSSLCKAAVWLS